MFCFSSRRRHTRCALVTGVQTCALPICNKHCSLVEDARLLLPQPVEIGRGEPPFLVRAAPPPAGAAAGRIDQYTGEAFGRACEPVRPALAEYFSLDDGDASPLQARRRTDE